MIKFAMFDDGTIREYRYRGVLLFKTSKHRAFTRRIREEFIEEVATMQKRNADYEEALEAIASPLVSAINSYINQHIPELTGSLARKQRTIAEHVLDKRKNLPKPTADELLKETLKAIEEEIELFGHGQTIRDMRGKLRSYFADQESEADDE